ncbi:MAG: hypothetical protein ACOYJL_03130 [Tractidigestivibacter sp.]|jgi:hypothetical protein|uniref:hypothetical protein n=1 Tax=Tractidigestivibacter sp. TaxID=2847320 RepID=UPI003D914FAE
MLLYIFLAIVTLGIIFGGSFLDRIASVGYSAFWIQLIASSLIGVAFLVGGVIIIVYLINKGTRGELLEGDEGSHQVKVVLAMVCLSLMCLAIGAILMLAFNDYVRDIPYLSDPIVADLTDISTDTDDSGDSTTYYVRGVDEQGQRLSFSVSRDVWEHYSSGEHPLVTVSYLPNSHVVISMLE